MAKRVVILEKQTGGGNLVINAAFWFTVPTARRVMYAGLQAASRWKNASTQENADIAAGVVREEVDTMQVPQGTSQAAILAAFEGKWSDMNAAFQARNPWDRYGSFWDGTSWTAGGIA